MTAPAMVEDHARTHTDMADRLAFLALVLAGGAAATGLAVPGLYRDAAEMVREAQATDLVTLVIAVPVLALGLARARAGSASARMITLGAIGFLAYSYAIYAFSVVINALTPVHLAILGLTVRSLVLTSRSRSRSSPWSLSGSSVETAEGTQLPSPPSPSSR